MTVGIDVGGTKIADTIADVVREPTGTTSGSARR
jgi:hypothetical protein